MRYPNPLVSIILPVYNGEQFLASSIESILTQSFENFELIILDDGSKDKSPAIIKEYAEKDDRIITVQNTSNLKLPKTLNKGHKISRGTYCTWTSDDNLLEREFLEVLLKNIEENNCDLVYANFFTINKAGERQGKIESKSPTDLLYGSVVGAAFLYKKEVFTRSKGYDEDLFLLEDYDFWLRSALHSKFYHVNKFIYHYRKHEKSLSFKIHQNKTTQDQFKSRLFKSLDRVGKQLEWHPESIKFFIRLHLYLPDTFMIFKKNHKEIVQDLRRFKKALGYNKNEVDNLELWKRLRGNWSISESQLNLKSLFFVFTKYPELLKNRGLSKKSSLHLIKRCLFNL